MRCTCCRSALAVLTPAAKLSSPLRRSDGREPISQAIRSARRARLGRLCELREGVHERAQLKAALRQSILDARRPRVDDLSLEDAGFLEIRQALGERCRRDPSECVEELVEADGALVRDIEDGDRPAPLEEARRAANLLGKGRAATTAHAPAAARARARAPRRGS